MNTDSLKYKSLKNVSYNMFGYIWMLAFSAFITPIIVFKLGLKDYGIYIFINTLLSLLGLLDIGVSTAATKYIAEYHSGESFEKLKSLIHSLNTVYLIMGLVGFILFVTSGFVGYAFFINQIPSYSLYLSLFMLAGIIFFISSLNSVYVVIPTALQRFDISNKIGVIQTTLTQLTILFLVMMGYRLDAIFISQLFYTAVFAFIMYFLSTKMLSLPHLKFGWDKEEIKRCYKFGLGTTINTVASSSLTYLDRLLIPVFLGPSQLTYYTLPGSVGGKVPGIANNLAGVIFPMTSSLHSAGNKEGLEKLYTRSLRLITILSTAMTASIIFFAYEIMLYWLNADFAEHATMVLIILTLTNFILALLSPLTGFLLGLGKVRFLSLSSVAMAILNVILLFLLVPPFGIVGASWAYLLSLLPVAFMFYYTEHEFLKLPHRQKYYLSLFLKLAVTSICLYFLDTYLILPFVKSFTTLFITGPLSVLCFLILYKILGFVEKEDWHDLINFAKTAKAKLPFQKTKNT